MVEQRRHGDERAQVRGDAIPQLQRRQKGRGKAKVDCAIDQRNRGVDRGNGAEHAKRAKNRKANSGDREDEQRRRKKDCGDKRNRRHIAADAERSVDARRPISHGQAIGNRLFEGAAPAREQMIAWVAASGPLGCWGVSPGPLCRKHRRASDIELRAVRAARQFLDCAAVERARWEIHALEVAAGRENSIDEAEPLEQLLPVDIGNQAQAGDDVANRDVRRALPAMYVAHDCIGCRVLDRQTLVEPCQRRRDLRILIAQPMHELDRKGSRERPALMRDENDSDRLGRSAACAEQTVGEAVRHLPRGTALGDLAREASEILDQNNPQRDRHRPEFANGERLYLLIGFDEANQHLAVETAIGMGDEGPGDAEHPGIAGERPSRELREVAGSSRAASPSESHGSAFRRDDNCRRAIPPRALWRDRR